MNLFQFHLKFLNIKYVMPKIFKKKFNVEESKKIFKFIDCQYSIIIRRNSSKFVTKNISFFNNVQDLIYALLQNNLYFNTRISF